MSFDVHQLDTFLLVGSAVTLLAVLAVRVSSRVGLPSLLIYLLMGVLLGESVIGIGFEDAELAHAIGFGALAIILAEGGVTTNWRETRSSVGLGLMLATVGASLKPDSASRAPVIRRGNGTTRSTENTAAASVGEVTAPSRTASSQGSPSR